MSDYLSTVETVLQTIAEFRSSFCNNTNKYDAEFTYNQPKISLLASRYV